MADGTVIIKRIKKGGHGGHHGGAWKVAYADFVTAMMAFFLLMWLLNATTEAQRRGLADYFSPMNVLSRNNSGTGQPFGGHTPYDQGTMASDRGADPVMQGKAPPPPDEDIESDQSSVGRTPSPTEGQATQAGRAGKQQSARGNATAETDQQGEHAPGGG